MLALRDSLTRRTGNADDRRDFALLDRRIWQSSIVCSDAKESLDRAAFVHRAVALRYLLQRQHEIEYSARIDRAVAHQVDELGEEAAHRSRSTVQVDVRVKQPLTAFKEDLSEGKFNPVGRWKQKFPPEQLVRFEALIGDYMRELGYPLVTSGQNGSLRSKAMHGVYSVFYPVKQWAKVNTPLSRMMVSYSDMLFDK